VIDFTINGTKLHSAFELLQFNASK